MFHRPRLKLDYPCGFVTVGDIVKRPRCLGALALGVLLPLGCGPVEYISQVSTRAATALAQAERDEADVYAPYEYRMAAEYYRESRVKGGQASFQIAIEYGGRCEGMAHKARTIAREKGGRDKKPARKTSSTR